MRGLYVDAAVCQNLAIKPALRALDWANLGTQEAQHARMVCCRSNTVLSVMDMPQKLSKLRKSVISLGEQGTLESSFEKIINIFKKFTSLIGVVVSSLQVAHEEGIFPLSDNQFSILNGIGFVGSLALFLKSITDIKKHFTKLISCRVGTYTSNLSLLKLIGRICGVIAGIFGMLTFAMGGELEARLILLGVSTISLTISISKYYLRSFYYEKQVDNNTIML